MRPVRTETEWRARRVVVMVAGLAAGLVSCGTPTPSSEVSWREQRQEAVLSVLPPGLKSTFPGVSFFAFDPRFRVRAMIEPVTPPERLEMPASDGRVRPALRVGRLRLQLPGGTAVLAVYRLLDSPDPRHLFLPFRDELAGTETYGAGRYVELLGLPGGVVEVDFNRAYNPDCAYGIVAQCPLTPAENTVAFAIAVGEKMPAGHS